MITFVYLIIFVFFSKYLLTFFGYLICTLFASHATRKESNSEIKKPKPVATNRVIKKTVGRFLHGLMRQTIIETGKIPSHLIRNFIYRYVYRLQIQDRVIIYGNSEIIAPYNIKIGKGTIIGSENKLDGRGEINIGKNVNLSTGVWIWTEQHDTQSPQFSKDSRSGKVTIGDRAWIGSRVTVLPGVEIGEGAVIAAGAVVTKNIDPFTINAGIPAKKIRDRNRDLAYEFDGDNLFFV